MLYVLLSVYKNDRLPFLRQSLISLFDQEYTDFKLYIIIDGTLPPDTNNYLQSLNDKRVVIIERAENKGLARSLNELLVIVLSKPDCKFIARMDADDISMVDRFSKQVEFLEINENIDCVGSWAIEINEDGSEYFRKKMPKTHDECYQLFRKRDCLIHPSVMFRKSFFSKAGLYPEDTYFGEDTIMWAQGFANGCRYANIPEYLLCFRLDNNFFLRRRGIKHAKSIIELRQRVSDMLGFGYKEKLYSYLYGVAKLMPTKILNIIYKITR